jgi:Mg2+-importing ATPase
VISAKDFFINQSALTGESFPVEKAAGVVSMENPSLSDLTNIVFSGTNVVTGTATVIVLKTGRDTEFGKIAHNLSQREQQTDFTMGINKFSNLILKTTVFIVLAIFLINSWLKKDFFESFMFAIAVAVGLTPELLPMILSITMSAGSVKMAEKGVIVKKLVAIPNFGSMDVLCTDKTGTLTEDRIVLVKYTDLLGKDSEDVLLHAYLTSFFQTGISNPMDEAVKKFKNLPVSKYEKIDEIPFDFLRKRMSVVVENGGKRTLISKGAPEEVFKECKFYWSKGKKVKLSDANRNKAEEVYYRLSKDGYRVLAIAIKNVETDAKVYEVGDEVEMTLLGFIAFLDPAKTSAKGVIKKMEKAGVTIKIITGDNELVTERICAELDIPVKGVLLGYQIDGLTDDALRVVVEKTTVFARFSPDEKNRIIGALKANGHVVGYMGDGINDAPSLKSADVGISVENAVDVAKESADIILTEKNLKALLDGILEGRKTFGNSMKYIMMGVSSNFGNMFSVIGAVIFLPFLPMLPIQILLNNLLYDFSQVTIPGDNVDSEYIASPKRWDMPFVKKFMVVFGLISSGFDIFTFYILYVVFAAGEKTFQTGWFIESLATQTLIIHIIRTKKLPFLKSRAAPGLLISTVLVVAVGWILPYTAVGKFFGFAQLSPQILITIGIIVLVYLITVEIGKRIFYRFVELK